METGIVFDIDHFAVHDGPGIRSCLYLKGCPLRCEWCHSPESQGLAPELLFAPSRCVGCGLCVSACPRGAQRMKNGRREYLREKCMDCGACASICPSGALFVSGRKMTDEEAVRELAADRIFYKNSGGGVTISGGECLLQAEFVLAVLKGLRKEEIQVIVETSGYGDQDALLEMAEDVQMFYYDYKLGDPEAFRRYTKGELAVVLGNLEELRKRTDAITLRIPLIPGITDTQDNILHAYKLARELSIGEIHFLPYNRSAGAKYEWCGREYTLGEREADMKRAAELQRMAPCGLKVTIMK